MSEIERQISYGFTYMWSLKYDTSERMSNRHREQIWGFQEWEEVRVGWIRSLRLADANYYTTYDKQDPTI